MCLLMCGHHSHLAPSSVPLLHFHCLNYQFIYVWCNRESIGTFLGIQRVVLLFHSVGISKDVAEYFLITTFSWFGIALTFFDWNAFQETLRKVVSEVRCRFNGLEQDYCSSLSHTTSPLQTWTQQQWAPNNAIQSWLLKKWSEYSNSQQGIDWPFCNSDS